MNKTSVCRLKAIGWVLVLILTFVPVSLGCGLVWITSQIFSRPRRPRASLQGKKTVLVTGAPLSKALQMARVMGRAGHKVIVADQNPDFQFSMPRFSKYVEKFIMIAPSLNYEDELVRIWREEKVDWFLPVSHITYAIPDTKAKSRMQAEAKKAGRTFADLGINDSSTASTLDDKNKFLSLCQRLGLKVPDFRSTSKLAIEAELRSWRSEGLFNGKHYFLKPLELQRTERLDMTPIPSEKAAFERYVDEHLKKKDLSVPYLLNEFINGPEFTANVICKDGKIYMFQAVPSCSILTNYVSIEHPRIKTWVETFVSKTRLSGLVCFDFLEDANNGEVYCIECNPRLHSAIVCFNTPTLMDDLAGAISAALTEDVNYRTLSLDKHPQEMCWTLQELEKLINGESSLGQALDLLWRGRDAIWNIEDPWPFFALNYIQMPYLLIRAFINGDQWNKVNFCLGQVL